MPSVDPQPVAGPSTQVLQPHNLRKRSGSSVETRDSKKLKKEATTDSVASSTKDKKKRGRKRKRTRKTPIVTPQNPTPAMARPRSASVSSALTPLSSDAEEPDTPATTIPEDAPAVNVDESEPSIQDKGKGKATSPTPSEALPSRIARLTQQHQEQSVVLEQHQNLLQSLQQSLTCQICLDLLHKPFALAPCGHVTCYNCLVRWFTSPPDEGAPPARHQQNHIYRRKTCPVCRTVVIERPVEVWGIKSMVSTLARSGLAVLPEGVEPIQTGSAPAANATGPRNDDPWHNIFRAAHRLRGIAPPIAAPQNAEGGGNNLEDLGMYDAEDGGIYRCLDCMHEIWDGVCSSCNRPYPGHQAGQANANDHGAGPFAEAFMNILARHRFNNPYTDSEDESDFDDMPPVLDLLMPRSDDDDLPEANHWDLSDGDETGEEYEGSFIDDEGPADHISIRSSDHGGEEDGQDDEMMDDHEPGLAAMRAARLRRFGIDDEADLIAEVGAGDRRGRGRSAVPPPSSRNSRGVILDFDSDEEPPRRLTRSIQSQARRLGGSLRMGRGQQNPRDGLAYGDDDDEEDDEPRAGPSRQPTNRGRHVNARASSSRTPMVVVVDSDEEGSRSDSYGDSDNERPRHYVRFDEWEGHDDNDDDEDHSENYAERLLGLDFASDVEPGEDEDEELASPPPRTRSRSRVASGSNSALHRSTRSSSSRHRR
ncbi:hypothetical protein BDN72DRAFT_831994 [Pluteus cervinus]|uniref:Uncharacterized protein n=1 Tax=Pluteus cervinus TaxID=181527 RepID=A0ACD3BCU6_9AGAR|nr:hypothetical protein BDN72DRAFT_831994 [Pluteus cervinus]